MIKSWAVVIDQLFYPEVYYFDTYEDAFEKYQYECKQFNDDEDVTKVLLVNISQGTIFGETK